VILYLQIHPIPVKACRRIFTTPTPNSQFGITGCDAPKGTLPVNRKGLEAVSWIFPPGSKCGDSDFGSWLTALLSFVSAARTVTGIMMAGNVVPFSSYLAVWCIVPPGVTQHHSFYKYLYVLVGNFLPSMRRSIRKIFGT
jgi:hypothetical protein